MFDPNFYNPKSRPFNPTYTSNNINYSMRNYMGFANHQKYKQPININNINQSNNIGFKDYQFRSQSLSSSPSSLTKAVDINYNQNQNLSSFIQNQNIQKNKLSYSKAQSYQTPTSELKLSSPINYNYNTKINPQVIQRKLIKKISEQDPFKKSTSHLQFQNISKLSKLGTSSLKKLTTVADDVQVFEKQTKKFDIITNNDRKYYDTIKIHPKYHLETQDQCYKRRKSLIQGKLQDYDKLNRQIMKKSIANAMGNSSLVKSQFQQSSSSSSNFINKLQQRQINQLANQRQQKNNKKILFRPKALNNADEMKGII